MNSIIPFINKLTQKQKDIGVFTCFFAVIALVYGNTIFFKYCIDDQYYLWLYIEEGSSIKEYLQSLLQRFWGEEYRPVTYFTILMEALIFGEKPEIHHVFNLLYYLILCFSIYKVLCKFFSKHVELSFFLSVGISLLFLLHPSHSNVVSSIKNRETILSLFFGIWSFYVWMLYLDKKKIYLMLTSAALIVMGAYAKRDILPFFVILPFVGGLYTDRNNYKKILLPFAVMLFSIVVGTWMVQNFIAEPAGNEYAMNAYENILVTMDVSLFERIPYGLYLLGMYEKFMVWPFEYYFYFGYDVLPVVITWKYFIVLLAVIHVLFILLLGYLYRKGYKHTLLGPLIFFLSIAPFVLSEVTGYIAVRYSFIASLGFCIGIGQLTYFIFIKVKRKMIVFALWILMLGVLCSFSWLSFQRSLAWKDIDTLYSTDIPKISRSANANRMACLYYYIVAVDSDRSEHEELILKSHRYCDQALSIYEISEAIEFKAKGFELLNKPSQAAPLYNRLLTINNQHISALSFMAYHTKNNGHVEASINYFEKLIKAGSTNQDAYIQLTQLYNNKRRYNDAIDLNRRFYENGSQYDALLNFGDIFIAKGDTISALKNYSSALLYKKEDYILEAVLEISNQFGNDTMSSKLERLLEIN